MESERRWFLPWPLAPSPLPLPLLLPLPLAPLLLPLGAQGIESARRRDAAAAADAEVDDADGKALGAGPLMEWLARWWPRPKGVGGARLDVAGDADTDADVEEDGGRRARSGW